MKPLPINESLPIQVCRCCGRGGHLAPKKLESLTRSPHTERANANVAQRKSPANSSFRLVKDRAADGRSVAWPCMASALGPASPG